MLVKTEIIGKSRKNDINLPNRPFPLVGKLKVTYDGNEWHYDVVRNSRDTVCEMCFPDENYDYDTMTDCVFIGAYVGEKHIGLAVLENTFSKYMYLSDLKVEPEYRRHGIGSALIHAAKELSTEKGYKGIYTQAQDNNLIVCLFYLKNGFYIGGFDSNIYKWIKQAGKADIIFYLDC